MATWDISVNSTSLNTEGSGVSRLTGMGGIPARDFYNQATYAQDGESSSIGGIGAGVCGLVMWWDDHDRDTGIQPDNLEDRQAVAWNNWQWINSLFISDYLLTLAVQVPGLSTLTDTARTRVALAQLITNLTPNWDDSMTSGNVVMGFKIPEGYWHAPSSTDGLDANGYKTITYAAGERYLVLPTDVYPMNGAIEDLQFFITNGANPIKTIQVKANNRGGAAAGYPTMVFTTPRTTGLIPASGKLVVDCKKHTALMTTSGGVTENVFKFDGSYGGRPGSLLRLLPPYTMNFTATPYTSGASMAAVQVTIKYRPSFI